MPVEKYLRSSEADAILDPDADHEIRYIDPSCPTNSCKGLIVQVYGTEFSSFSLSSKDWGESLCHLSLLFQHLRSHINTWQQNQRINTLHTSPGLHSSVIRSCHGIHWIPTKIHPSQILSISKPT